MLALAESSWQCSGRAGDIPQSGGMLGDLNSDPSEHAPWRLLLPPEQCGFGECTGVLFFCGVNEFGP